MQSCNFIPNLGVKKRKDISAPPFSVFQMKQPMKKNRNKMNKD